MCLIHAKLQDKKNKTNIDTFYHVHNLMNNKQHKLDDIKFIKIQKPFILIIFFIIYIIIIYYVNLKYKIYTSKLAS